MAGDFYLRGLDLLGKGVRFTPREQAVFQWLRSAAQHSDAVYFDTLKTVEPGSDLERGIEELKTTLRSLNKAPILQAHYDRERELQRPISPDGPLPDGEILRA